METREIKNKEPQQNMKPSIQGERDLKSPPDHCTLRWEKFLFCCLWHMVVQSLHKSFQAVTGSVSLPSPLETHSCCFCYIFFQLPNVVAVTYNAEFLSLVALPSEWLK